MSSVLGIDLDTHEPQEVTIDEIVGEGKKFEKVEDALSALLKKATHADSHIAKIEKENSDLREKLIETEAKQSSVKELFQLLKEKQVDNSYDEDDSDTGDTKHKKTASSVTLEDIERLVSEKIASSSSSEKKKETLTKSRDALVRVFGSEEGMKTAVKAFINGSEERKNLVDVVGATDPEALVRLISGKPSQSSTTINHNRDGFTENETFVRPALTWTEAKKIRDTDSKLFKSHSFQKKLFQTIAEYKKSGKDFYKT